MSCRTITSSVTSTPCVFLRFLDVHCIQSYKKRISTYLGLLPLTLSNTSTTPEGGCLFSQFWSNRTLIVQRENHSRYHNSASIAGLLYLPVADLEDIAMSSSRVYWRKLVEPALQHCRDLRKKEKGAKSGTRRSKHPSINRPS